MPQKNIWEQEYANPKLVTGIGKPNADILRFVKWYKKKIQKVFLDLDILDLGSGTGKNGNYFAELGASVFGIEIASNALEIANTVSKKNKLNAQYIQGSIGAPFCFEENKFDLVLDVTSSNSLSENERENYIQEIFRVLKKQGIFFFRGLLKDGDKNAKNLLKNCPGIEYDTYIMPEMGLVERVWSESDFRNYYGRFFDIIFFEKRDHYTRFGGKKYKRRFMIAYMKKKE